MFSARGPFARRSRGCPAYAAGLAALRAGRHAEAVAAFTRAATEASEPRERAAAHNKRGVAEIGRGERDAARAAFARALVDDARCAAALTNLGNMLVEERADLDAIDYFRAALELEPRLASAHRGLGVALRALGRTREAVSAFRAADRHAFRRPSDA